MKPKIGDRWGTRVIAGRGRAKGTWIARCKCGAERTVGASDLKKPSYCRECFYVGLIPFDEINEGDVFGCFTVEKVDSDPEAHGPVFHLRCSCGELVQEDGRIMQKRNDGCSHCYTPPGDKRITLPTRQYRKNGRLLTYRGEKRSVASWAKIRGIPAGTITSRLNRGKDPDSAMAR